MYIHNPGQNPVTLRKFRYIINGKVSNIREGNHPIDDSNPRNTYVTKFDNPIKFPYILTGKDSAFIIHRIHNLMVALSYNGYSGKIKLSAYFETAQNKKVKTKNIDIDIEKFKM